MTHATGQGFFDFLFRPVFSASNASIWRLSTWRHRDSRQAMQHSLLRLLAAGQHQNLDLSRLVGNLADEHRGRYRRLLRRLSRRLSEGTPLVNALEQTPDALSDQDVLSIRFATQTGTLDRTYEQLLRRGAEQPEPRGEMVYPIVLLVLTCLMLSYLAIYIFPDLEELYDEAGLALPAGFHRLLMFVRTIGDHFAVLAVVVVLLLTIVGSAWFRKSCRRVLATRLSGNVAQVRTAELLRMLATATEAGRPMPAALSTLARYHFDSHVRGKLLFARNEVEQGTDVWSSLAAAKLLTQRESDAFGDLSTNESRTWAMRRLADQKQEQVALKSRRRVAAVEPALILTISAIVLWAAIAMFGSLSKLILSIS